MTKYEKRCQDCACLIKKNGVWCCDEKWGAPCNEVEDCPEEIELEEVEEINEKAKSIKVDHGTDKPKAKTSKPKTHKTSDVKIALFNQILGGLNSIYGENVQILKENKLISVQIDDTVLKIDIIEQRKPKN